VVVNSLTLRNLRNHVSSDCEFCDGTNVIFGPNGAGKTTILEALSLCSLTKTFLPTSDAEMVTRGASSYIAECSAVTDAGSPYTVRVTAGTTTRKSISSSYGKNLKPKDIIGVIPMVILSPDDKSITFGAPADRRVFIDRLLSQCSQRYLEELMQLRRILKQRNALLAARAGFFDRSQFEVWTSKLVQCGAEITIRRRNFLRDFSPYFLEAYRTLSLGTEDVEISYLPDLTLGSDEFLRATKEELERAYALQAERMDTDELRRQVTLWGPQKDDVDIRINGGRAREHASQGQHKSLLICLKNAEFEYLRSVRNETPLLLLDDIFSELDEMRTSRVFETVIAAARQCFITTTEQERIRNSAVDSRALRTFFVRSGTIECI
jgi:DNA replication and repair protein RecF